jgi:hypothetical protein
MQVAAIFSQYTSGLGGSGGGGLGFGEWLRGLREARRGAQSARTSTHTRAAVCVWCTGTQLRPCPSPGRVPTCLCRPHAAVQRSGPVHLWCRHGRGRGHRRLRGLRRGRWGPNARRQCRRGRGLWLHRRDLCQLHLCARRVLHKLLGSHGQWGAGGRRGLPSGPAAGVRQRWRRRRGGLPRVPVRGRLWGYLWQRGWRVTGRAGEHRRFKVYLLDSW